MADEPQDQDTQHDGEEQGASPPQSEGRRTFIKRIGQMTFALSLAGAAGMANAQQACSQNNPDANCSSGSVDVHCGISLDEDQSCGNFMVPDANCSAPCSDAFDSDGDCGDGSSDSSCGDCNDNHDTDDNCGSNGDEDGLCGHPHYVGLDQDNNCTADPGSSDAYCGIYCFEYQWGGALADTDQHCGISLDTDNTFECHQSDACRTDTTAPEAHSSA